ncbi:DUF2913 family protein [Shewanella colwelliana]|uniref:DUF2913 family protein n=1 Tax=Shewanella colwelliana TaxID=23 RepID=UPI003735C43C
MSDGSYYALLSSIVTDSLLHLYLTVSETTRFTPTVKRNEILIKYLKPKLKDKRYQSAKTEIKRLLMIGRHKQGDLENKLHEVNSSILDDVKNVTDAQKLFDLLDELRVKYKIESRFIIENEKRKARFVYLLQSHIENGFDDDGKQVAPISLFWESPKSSQLESMVNEVGLFKAVTEDINEDSHQVHVILHPMNMMLEGKEVFRQLIQGKRVAT